MPPGHTISYKYIDTWNSYLQIYTNRKHQKWASNTEETRLIYCEHVKACFYLLVDKYLISAMHVGGRRRYHLYSSYVLRPTTILLIIPSYQFSMPKFCLLQHNSEMIILIRWRWILCNNILLFQGYFWNLFIKILYCSMHRDIFTKLIIVSNLSYEFSYLFIADWHKNKNNHWWVSEIFLELLYTISINVQQNKQG